ncbi:MAG: RHS repeat-associated core domain-containing protein [Rhizomicrobium sp.]
MKRYSAIRSCNVSNRLIAAAKTGMSATYAYDPAGRRMSKTVTGGSYAGTMFFLDAGDDEIAEYDGSGNLLRRYVPGRGVDRPIAMVTAAGAKSFFHQDKTGSVIAMSDTSGNIATNNGVADGPYTYDAYGNCLIGGAACSGGVPFKYTGRRYDPETGLYFNRARFYSATVGRFLQTDPIGYGPDLDWYAYVANDPTDKIDPSGESVNGGCVGGGQVWQKPNCIPLLDSNGGSSGANGGNPDTALHQKYGPNGAGNYQVADNGSNTRMPTSSLERYALVYHIASPRELAQMRHDAAATVATRNLKDALPQAAVDLAIMALTKNAGAGWRAAGQAAAAAGASWEVVRDVERMTPEVNEEYRNLLNQRIDEVETERELQQEQREGSIVCSGGLCFPTGAW